MTALTGNYNASVLTKIVLYKRWKSRSYHFRDILSLLWNMGFTGPFQMYVEPDVIKVATLLLFYHYILWNACSTMLLQKAVWLNLDCGTGDSKIKLSFPGFALLKQSYIAPAWIGVDVCNFAKVLSWRLQHAVIGLLGVFQFCQCRQVCIDFHKELCSLISVKEQKHSWKRVACLKPTYCRNASKLIVCLKCLLRWTYQYFCIDSKVWKINIYVDTIYTFPWLETRNDQDAIGGWEACKGASLQFIFVPWYNDQLNFIA